MPSYTYQDALSGATIKEMARTVTTEPDGVTVQRKFYVTPGSKWKQVEIYLIGGCRIIGGTIYRQLPDHDAFYENCYCVAVTTDNVEQLNTPAAASTDAEALHYGHETAGVYMMATYKTIPTPDDKDIVSANWEFGARALTLTKENWQWKDDSAELGAEDTAATKVIPSMSLTVQRNFMLRMPSFAIASLMGRVNKRDLTIRNITYAPETVRFDSATAVEQLTTDGDLYYNIVYRFSVQPTYDKCKKKSISFIKTLTTGVAIPTLATIADDTVGDAFVGWNYLYRESTGRWEVPVTTVDTTRTIYLYDDNAPTQLLNGVSTMGFDLLWHPAAR